jgi:hypothetical protein
MQSAVNDLCIDLQRVLRVMRMRCLHELPLQPVEQQRTIVG